HVTFQYTALAVRESPTQGVSEATRAIEPPNFRIEPTVFSRGPPGGLYVEREGLMPEQPLREQSLDDLVAKVQGLAAAAAASEVRSIMAVFARCTIEISDRARQLSEDVNQAKKILGERLTELSAQMKASTQQATVDMQGAKEAIVPVLAELTGELKRTRTTIDIASSAAS